MAPNPSPPQRKFEHPASSHAKKKRNGPYPIQPITAFYVFFAAGMIAALYAPIQDCDETFNYWEPAHYLSHGYGLQTWEYSPDFAIRSWLYVGLHSIVGSVRRLLPQSSKASLITLQSVSEFYFIRYGLAFVCALCQTVLFKVISLTMNGRIGMFFLISTVICPGNFHASASFLPSSFAMYMCMLGAASFMNWRGGIKTAHGIFWFAAAGILGWPFASALCAPYLLEELVLVLFSDKDAFIESIVRFFRGVIAGLIVLKIAVVSWNIVKYNIFSSTGGPDLYGTEPWTFYFKNLALNFNIWFVLALLALPLFLLQKIPARLKFLAVSAVMLLALDVSLARLYGIYSAYSAPLRIYSRLWQSSHGQTPVGREEDIVCFGKEWYRFPSSYFLPRDMHAKFIRSEFRGLLPGEFSEAKIGFGFWSGTWLPTSGLNDRNEEDPGKYVDIRACSFLVDTQYPLRTEPLPPNEPDYIADKDTWEVVQCKPFLDAANTHILARTLWVPELEIIPEKFRRKWGQHCLVQRKRV
ncbi:Alpha-1,2-mannosyltransferase alg9 [Metarhizium anisopliae]